MRKYKCIYIQIRSVNLGSYAASEKAQLMLCVGPRDNFLPFSHIFKAGEKRDINHTWKYMFKDENDSSFVVVLFKKHLFGNKEIGELEFMLNGFEKNTVVSATYKLQSPIEGADPAEITMDVHLDECGAAPFQAPEGFFFEESLVYHDKFYGPPETKLVSY